jgi:hypothetical protein
MTRRSKRELERALEEIDVENSRERTAPKIEEHCSEDVVEFVYGVCRDLFRLSYRNAGEIVNERDDAVATEQFLELVRDEYGIEPDSARDERVLETLAASVKGDRHARPLDVFQTAPISVATHVDVRGKDGSELTELLDTGREDEAEEALIRSTYSLVAGDGGAPAEAPA